MSSEVILPKYEVIEQIGHGQFSVVYKARWLNAPMPMESAGIPARPLSLESGITQPLGVQEQNFQTYPYNRDSSSEMTSSQSSNNLIDLNSNNQTCHRARSSTAGASDSKYQRDQPKYVALKRIKFYEIQNSAARNSCMKEVKLLQQLKHPNIINYNISFIQNNELYIVLELADGGDLSKLIKYFQKRNQLLKETSILKYFAQVCSAVEYIHSKRILHRDIKPANIFMTSDGVVKLGDFGLGRFFSQNTFDAHSYVGTFYYMSPERIYKSGYGFSSDVWSLGCVLYELITLNSPFSVSFSQPGNNQMQQNNNQSLQMLFDRIMRADYPGLHNFTDISPSIRQLAEDCLRPNPEHRPNMGYICGVVNEAYKMLKQ